MKKNFIIGALLGVIIARELTFNRRVKVITDAYKAGWEAKMDELFGITND